MLWLRTGQTYVKKTLPSALFASDSIDEVGQEGDRALVVSAIRNGANLNIYPLNIFPLLQVFAFEMAMLREFRCPNLVRYFDGAANAKRREAFIVRRLSLIQIVVLHLIRVSRGL